MARKVTVPASESTVASDATRKQSRKSAKRSVAVLGGAAAEGGIAAALDKGPSGSKRKAVKAPVDKAAGKKAVVVAAKATRQSRPMGQDHRDALAAGRTEGRIVRTYLEAIEAAKPDRKSVV